MAQRRSLAVLALLVVASLAAHAQAQRTLMQKKSKTPKPQGSPAPATDKGVMLFYRDSAFQAADYAPLVADCKARGLTLKVMDAITTGYDVAFDVESTPNTVSTKILVAAHGSSCATLSGALASGDLVVGGAAFVGCAPGSGAKDIPRALLFLLGEMDGVYPLDRSLGLWRALQPPTTGPKPIGGPFKLLAVLSGVTNAQFANGTRVSAQDVLPKYAAKPKAATAAVGQLLALFAETIALTPFGVPLGASPKLKAALKLVAPNTATIFESIDDADRIDRGSACINLHQSYLEARNGSVARPLKLVILWYTNTGDFNSDVPQITNGGATMQVMGNEPILATTPAGSGLPTLTCKGRRRPLIGQVSYGLGPTDAAAMAATFFLDRTEESVAGSLGGRAMWAAARKVILPYQLLRFNDNKRPTPDFSVSVISDSQVFPTFVPLASLPAPSALPASAAVSPVPSLGVHTTAVLFSSWPPSAAEIAEVEAKNAGAACDLACQQENFGAYYVKMLGARGMLELMNVAVYRF